MGLGKYSSLKGSFMGSIGEPFNGPLRPKIGLLLLGAHWALLGKPSLAQTQPPWTSLGLGARTAMRNLV